MIKEIQLDNNKYTIIMDEEGGYPKECLRNGQTWRDLTGDNLIYWLVCELKEAKSLIEELKDKERQDHISMLQYANLREHFNKLVTDVLGSNYYNMGMDVYTADQLCCEDLTNKLK